LFFILALAVNVNAVYTPDESTVALWHFDEGSGNTAFDSTINGNNGNLVTVTWTTDSIDGFAVQFNGVSSVIDVIKTSSVDVTKQVTLEAWIMRQSNVDGMIISRNGPYYLAVRNNVVSGGIYAGSPPSWTEFSGSATILTDRWYHLAITYDGSNISLYVNGELDNSMFKTGLMPVISQQLHIGWGEPGQNQYFQGIIDEARISSIARTSFDATIPTVSTTTTVTSTTSSTSTSTTTSIDVLAKITELENRLNQTETKVGFLEKARIKNTTTNIAPFMPL